MKEILKSLNEKILINDLIVRKMKYEINMLFREYPSKEKANMLALKINNQLDKALVGLTEEDKISIRKLIILDSFMVVPNPVSDHIHYGHVFTTLTNFDEKYTDTKNRLSKWLDLNTDITYEEESLKQYIKRYKIKGENTEIRVAAIEYEPEEKPAIKRKYRLKKKVLMIPVSLILLILLLLFSTTLNKKETPQTYIDVPEVATTDIETVLTEAIDEYSQNTIIIPEEYYYSKLNYNAIFTFLKERNSKLTEKDYISTIDEYAESYDINPLLLIAIIGQEQGYVPKEHADADEIINNPYNVYNSWVDYNSTFEDATIICLNTIANAMESYDSDEDFVDWLNMKYAEDENWSKGVKQIFTMLQSINLK